MDKIEKIIIDGVLAAGKKVKLLEGVYTKADATKDSTFDFGLPADKEAENILLAAIAKTGIDCQIVSEESETTGGDDSEYKIIMDPLDGTVNYSWGVPAYAISVGVFRKGEPFLGVVYDPNLDELFVGGSGGVTLNGEPLKPRFETEKILVNIEWFGADKFSDYIKVLRDAGVTRNMGSGVLSLCYGIVGRGDGTILIGNKPWDIAAGYIIAKKMGIGIEQIGGAEVDLTKIPIDLIAGTPRFLDTMRKILR